MFLKRLKLSNAIGLIRDIRFHAGMNLIVDETPGDDPTVTGNNVGKTTTLVLIDFCLGANAKGIYTDPESKKTEDPLVKNFLIDTEVLVTLTLGRAIDGPSEMDLVIERSFKPRAPIRRINGRQMTEDEFEEELTNRLFPGHYPKKPTFRQIIAHNFRYKEPALSNTLRHLDNYTKDVEYESLHLFLLGCNVDFSDEKQRLLQRLLEGTRFKSRLETQQTRSAYEAALSLLKDRIEILNARRTDFKLNSTLEADLEKLSNTKHRISVIGTELARAQLRRELVQEAVVEVAATKAQIDVDELKRLYDEVSGHFEGLSRSFQELVAFHNSMVEERTRYVAKELPDLEAKISAMQQELTELIAIEAEIVARIRQSGSLEDLEELISEVNDAHRQRGEMETVIRQIIEVEGEISVLRLRLAEIENLFSGDAHELMADRLNKLNRHFAAISNELYGETYAIKKDYTTTRTGQRVLKFTPFTAFTSNFSSGKKQGEITCFDIAYTLFADELGIPCYHFLLNDKKELMHDNQLVRIAQLVNRKKQHVQFVASILRDKLPAELNHESNIILKLSQSDKLFRIELKGGETD